MTVTELRSNRVLLHSDSFLASWLEYFLNDKANLTVRVTPTISNSKNLYEFFGKITGLKLGHPLYNQSVSFPINFRLSVDRSDDSNLRFRVRLLNDDDWLLGKLGIVQSVRECLSMDEGAFLEVLPDFLKYFVTEDVPPHIGVKLNVVRSLDSNDDVVKFDLKYRSVGNTTIFGTSDGDGIDLSYLCELWLGLDVYLDPPSKWPASVNRLEKCLFKWCSFDEEFCRQDVNHFDPVGIRVVIDTIKTLYLRLETMGIDASVLKEHYMLASK